MKTSIKTLFVLGMTTLVVSASTLNVNAAVNTVAPAKGAEICRTLRMTPANTAIKKLIVTGNATVFLVQSNTEYVSYDESSKGKLHLKQEGNTLYVGSGNAEQVSVTVYVKDLYRIDASGNAIVKTSGNYKAKFLQVMLKDNATARIKANTESIYTVIDDNSNLKLLGTTASHIAKSEATATLDTEKFAALKTEYMPSDRVVRMNAKN